jgi:hypothetical protein
VKTFRLYRDRDVSGVSGTGVVADGVQFDDGVVVIRWRGPQRSTVVWNSLADAIAVHGHGGATRIEFCGPDGTPGRGLRMPLVPRAA